MKKLMLLSSLCPGFNKTALFLSLLLVLISNVSSNALDYYWVNGSGNWSGYASHWAKCSGCTGVNDFHDQVPTSMDNVFFDANSGFTAGNNTVTIDETIIFCMNMDWTGALNTPVFTGASGNALHIFGSLTLIANMDYQVNGNVRFLASSPGKTIATAGQTFKNNVFFNGPGGEWTLQDNFELSHPFFSTLSHQNGTLRTNGHEVKMKNFSGNSPGQLFLGTSTIRFVNSGFGQFSYTAPNFDGSTASIICTSTGDISVNAGLSIYDVTVQSYGVFRYGTVLHNLVLNGGGNVEQATVLNKLTAGNSVSIRSSFAHEAQLSGDANFDQNNTFDILTLSPGKIYTLESNKTQTITQTFNASSPSCSQLISLKSSSAGSQATIAGGGASANLNFLSVKDIAVTGTVFTAPGSVNLGNNTGWIFAPAPARVLYWVGGGGSWSDPNHWSLTSGGAGGECPPSASDDVNFNASSGFTSGSTVNIALNLAHCRNMNWTGVLNNPTLTSSGSGAAYQLFISGSLTFSPNMTNSYNGYVHFNSNTPGQAIATAGQTFKNNVFFNGPGGEWTLQDNFELSHPFFSNLSHQDGTLRTNGYQVKMRFFSGGNPGKLLLGASTLRFFNSSNGSFGYTAANFDGSTANIICESSGDISMNAGTSIYNVTIQNGGTFNFGKVLNNLVFATTGNANEAVVLNKLMAGGFASIRKSVIHEAQLSGDASFDQNNTFDILTLSPGKIYTLESNKTQTITNTFNASSPACSQPISIRSNSAGSQATIHAGGAAANLNHLSVKDIAVTGAVLTAPNSTNLGNNTGWSFPAPLPRTLFWVGGSGDWNDANHWSLNPGGTGGECLPSPNDDVNFDAGSGFTPASKTVTISSSQAFCRNMNWTGALNNPELFSAGFGASTLYISGSLTFSPAMSNNFKGYVIFNSNSSGQTVTSAGNSFKYVVGFNGPGGEWTLQDGIESTHTVFGEIGHISGTLRTAGHQMKMTRFNGGNPGIFFPGSSTLRFVNSGLGDFNYSPGNFDGSTASVICESSGNITMNNAVSIYDVTIQNGGAFRYGTVLNNLIFMNGGNVEFASVHKLTAGGAASIRSSFVHEADLLANASFEDNNTFDILHLSPGKTYTLEPGKVQTITPFGDFIALGTGGFPIEIKSTSSGVQATLHKDGDPVCLDFLYLTGINASGAGFTYAGANSDDVINNSGWIFAACPPCFSAPPAPAPSLAPASVPYALPGSNASLILQNLPANSEAVWFNNALTLELYASQSNNFQPVITGNITFFGAIRDLTTGCISALLQVNVQLVNVTPPVLNANASVTEVCAGEMATLVLMSLGQNEVAVWSDDAGMTNVLYSSAANNFQPVIAQNTTFYAAIKNTVTNETSNLIPVNVTVFSTPDADGDGLADNCDVCPNDAGNDFDDDGFCASNGDCDDNNFNVNPGATETCNNTDDDCDGLADTADPNLVDNIPPALSPCPSSITGLCGTQTVSWTPPAATDNCSVTLGSTHQPGTSFGVGTTTVTYTATDQSSNSVSCSFTVTIHPLPAVSIVQASLPGFCQGLSQLTANVSNAPALLSPLNYAWSGGLGTSQVVTASTNGTYSVSVTDSRGCSGTATTTLNVTPSNVLSSYTLLASKEIIFKQSTLASGGAGVMNAGEKAKFEQNSVVSTFAKAPVIEVKSGSTVATQIIGQASVTLPTFRYNTNSSNNNITVPAGQTMTLTGSIYGKIEVKENATLIFNNPEIFVEEIKSKDNATIDFAQDAEVMVKKKVDLKKDNFFNPGQSKVILYVDDDLDAEEGISFKASVFARKKITAKKAKSSKHSTMTGLFISLDKIDSDEYVDWNRSPNCPLLPPSGNLVAPPDDGEVQLDAFPGELSVDLSWVTNLDSETGQYELEKSADGLRFEQLAAQPPRTTGTAWKRYQARDYEPLDGANFYRLSVKKHDGSLIHSTVKKVFFERPADFTLSPNPASEEVLLHLSAFEGKACQSWISNSLGEVLTKQDFAALPEGRVRFSVAGLPEGIYFVYMQVEGRRPVSKKLAVTRR